jgi:retron-type reverse transcriptase
VKRYTSREVRQALVGKGNLQTLLSDRICDFNPYQPGALQKLSQIDKELALLGWKRARQLFAERPAVEALENIWASVCHLVEVRSFLVRGLVQDNDLEVLKRSKQLQVISADDKDLRDTLDDIFNGKYGQKTPDLLSLHGFDSEVRIRWGLASRVQRRDSYLELLRCAGGVASVSVHDALGLLKEALTECNEPNLPHITQIEAITLSDSEFNILSADPTVFKRIYSHPSSLTPTTIEKIRKSRLKYKADIVLIKKIYAHLSNRSWKQAGDIATELAVDRPALLAAKQVFLDIGEIADIVGVHSKEKWTYMPDAGHRNLVKIFGAKSIPMHWKFDAEKLAQSLADGLIHERKLSKYDIQQLGNTWSMEAKRSLIRAKRYRVLQVDDKVWEGQPLKVLTHAASSRPDDGKKLLHTYLPKSNKAFEIVDSVLSIGSKKFCIILEEVVSIKLMHGDPLLGPISWGELLSSEIGTESWRQAVSRGLLRRPRLEQLLYAVKNAYPNTTKAAFKQEAIALFKSMKTVSSDEATLIMNWIGAKPSHAKYIVPNLTQPTISKIANLKPGACTVESIKLLYQEIGEEHASTIWKMQLGHVTDSNQLLELAIEGAKKGWESDWNSSWLRVTGSVESRSRALIFLARHNLVTLRTMRRHFTEEVISSALLWTSNQLPYKNSFEKIFLELISSLGLRHGATLRWLLSNRSRGKAAGSKFDHLYERYEIPKKSGKLRKISSPTAGLKRIQKSIAVTLIDPLGAHPSAYGFVKGRSIVGNAQLHVGKKLVVNADVSNCFPSVRWPLVRYALMRDLSNRLSPLSISFLVDLCTAEGALPIGAPTSPAVLNRVMYKTDEILNYQAELRGCSYSRYADDITFSGNSGAVSLLGVARGVLSGIGLSLDPQKTNIFRRGRRQICTGLVVNEKVNVPRRIRKRVRAAVHAFENSKPMMWEGEQMNSSELRGRLEFLKMVAPDTASPLITRMNSAMSKSTSPTIGQKKKVAKRGKENHEKN